MNFFSRNFFQSKHSVYFVIMYSSGYSPAIMQWISTFSIQGLLHFS